MLPVSCYLVSHLQYENLSCLLVAWLQTGFLVSEEMLLYTVELYSFHLQSLLQKQEQESNCSYY